MSRSPSDRCPFSQTCLVGRFGSPTEIDYRKSKLVPTCSNLSNLEDLVLFSHASEALRTSAPFSSGTVRRIWRVASLPHRDLGSHPGKYRFQWLQGKTNPMLVCFCFQTLQFDLFWALKQPGFETPNPRFWGVNGGSESSIGSRSRSERLG